MKIDIQARGFTLTEDLRRYVERRLYFILGSYTDRIERIAFVLEKVKGSLEGLDYKSRIRLDLSNLPTLVVEDGGAYLYMAVDLAVGRAGRRLARTIYGEKNPAPFTLEHTLAPRFRDWSSSCGVR